KTGIQRISGEICRHSPPGTMIPVRLDSDHFVALPPALINAMGKYFQDATESGITEIRRLAAESGPPIRISPSDTVLVPEIFGQQRASFFRAMPEHQLRCCRFIIYDLLPLTHPEYFVPDMS